MQKVIRFVVVLALTIPGVAVVAADQVARGELSTLIFPEGHRTRDGEIGPFMRAGLRAILLRAQRPVYLIVVDGLWRARTTAASPAATPANSTPITLPFLFLAAAITLSATISTILSVHLLTILQARDIALAAAVALGALVGPSQVGARFIEMLIARYHHPIWTMLASALFMTIGIGTLWAGWPILSAALMFYGAGIGIESIARATLPLSLFDPANYARIMGKLAFPSLIAQAAAPSSETSPWTARSISASV